MVPIDGFYEWKAPFDPKKDKRKQPWYVHSSLSKPLMLAGLYADFNVAGENSDSIRCVALLTTSGSKIIHEHGLGGEHNRMPVILEDAKAAWSWLNFGKNILGSSSTVSDLAIQKITSLGQAATRMVGESWGLTLYPVNKDMTTKFPAQPWKEVKSDADVGPGIGSFFDGGGGGKSLLGEKEQTSPEKGRETMLQKIEASRDENEKKRKETENQNRSSSSSSSSSSLSAVSSPSSKFKSAYAPKKSKPSPSTKTMNSFFGKAGKKEQALPTSSTKSKRNNKDQRSELQIIYRSNEREEGGDDEDASLRLARKLQAEEDAK